MEAAVLGAVVTNIMAKLGEVVLKKGEQSSSLHDDIDEMIHELGMIAADMEDHLRLSVKGHVLNVQKESMKRMGRLAFDIEDCLDRFLPCAECEGQLSDRMKFVDKIQKLKKRVKAANSQKADYGVKGGQQASGIESVLQADYEDIIRHHVGIDKPKQELRDLLLSDRQKLVISMVGLGGSGKTTLARAVYDCAEIQEGFLCRAWAVASRHRDDIKGLLTAILQQLLPEVAAAELRTQQTAWIQDRIDQRLRDLNTRCLIVIDDYEKHKWEKIMDIFSTPGIRIVVTTRLQSVANACSSGDGYVYSMRSLSAEDSKILLKNIVSFFQKSKPSLEDDSAAIVHKCDGHPLALISVANHLNDQKMLTRGVCQDTSRLLGSRMDENKNNNFTKLGQVLMNTYISLPDRSLKTCLLYTSLFPNDRPVSRQTLTSRWLAEGYIDCQGPQNVLEAADDKFEELIDRNIIRSIEESNNGKAKTCKAQGIMHQFILHRSTSWNFITSFGAKNRRNFRHLVIENHRVGTASGMDHGSGPAASSGSQLSKLVKPLKKVANVFKKSVSKKLRPRSLTIFGTAEEAVYADITNLQLLRVLDLKECSDFQAGHLEKIYKLMHLKYLSLGRSVTDLSVDGMKRLHRLETLDLRKTMIETLPLEIIILPHLAHLFGKVKLNKLGKTPDKTLLEKSKLHTLAGVVIDNNSGFPELMGDMKKLKKVKIWCEITSTDSNYTILLEAIHKFSQAGMDTLEGPRSLSLYLNDSSKGLLNHHQGENANASTSTEPIVFGYLSSLKLHGRPSQFEFCKSMCGLEELCLTSTSLTGDDLSKLSTLEQLVFLKLVEVHLAGLQINPGDFPRLQRLCLVVQEPIFPTIRQGALPILTSIQLLCKDLKGPCDHIQVESFQSLQEITLDSMVDIKTREIWEDRARIHPRRPRVLYRDTSNTRCVVKYVATDQVSSESPMDTSNTRSVVKYVATAQVSSEPPMLCRCDCAEICSHPDQGSLVPPTPVQGTA